MKPFKFTLEAVRTVREREEQSALREYVLTLRTLEGAKRRYEAVEEQIVAAWDDYRQALQRDAPSVEISRVQDYCEMLQARMREMESALQSARQKANCAFTRYLAAHQACAVVEKCVEKRQPRHEHGRRKHERKAVGDLAQRSLSLANLICRSRGTIWN